MKTRRARVRAWVVRPLLIALTPVALAVGWNLATANFAPVVEGTIYRSAQMRASGLARTVRDREIRTVINLRGHHPDQTWYRAERAATLAGGATQVDIALSSCEWMSRTQLRTLLDVLETSKPPILVHCWRGSERTGLTSALAILLREGSTLEMARDQFSLRYGFIRAGDGVVTIEHLEQYEGWLSRLGLAHSPDNLRRWADEGFVPGSPSREQWPYDPYPLVVTTRPTPDGPDEEAVWDERGRPQSRPRTASGPLAEPTAVR